MQASPEAGNVGKTHGMLKKLTKTTLPHLQKLARKQKMLKRLEKTHWRNTHKLAQKQKMLKRFMRDTGGILKS